MHGLFHLLQDHALVLRQVTLTVVAVVSGVILLLRNDAALGGLVRVFKKEQSLQFFVLERRLAERVQRARHPFLWESAGVEEVEIGDLPGDEVVLLLRVLDGLV